jgi:molecular chaperone GrpE
MSEADESPEAPAPEGHPEEAQGAEDGALLEQQLEEALREKEQFRAMGQRAQADLVNYRRRAADERDEAKRTANSRLLLNILSIVDDMGRALALVPQDAIAPGWYDGLELVLRNINQLLVSEGIVKIDAVGRDFGPWEFEAVLHEETDDTEEGKIIRVIREGYKHHDRVLRPAQVVVAKKPEPQAQHESSEEEAQ